MREYDQIADWYVAARNPEVGIADLDDFADALPPDATVLDVGCGDGIPITQRLVRRGFDVVGLDSSAEMIARYRANFPDVPAQCGRVEDAAFRAGAFDAVVAWGVLFHLTEADQKDVIGKIGGWLKPGGRFLFTSGDVDGVTEGEMDGVTFRYVSLGRSGYRDAIKEAEMRLDDAHRDAWDNCVYVGGKYEGRQEAAWETAER